MEPERGVEDRGNIAAFTLVLTCFVFNFVGRGVSDTFGVFLLPLEAEFDWRRSHLTGVYSAYMIAHGVAAPLAGVVIDRIGPRLLYGVGIACLASACFLAAHVDALWQLYLTVGIMGGVGVAAVAMVPASALVGRWFQGRLSSAMGLVYAGLGSGTLVLVPLSQTLVDLMGWRGAYTQLGWLVASLTLLLLLPWRLFGAGRPAAQGSLRPEQKVKRETVIELLRNRGFWGLFSVFFFTAFAIFTITPQAVAYLVSIGFTPLTAATAFGFVGLLSVFGVIITGVMADIIGRRRVIIGSYCLSMLGITTLMIMASAPSFLLLILFVIFFGSVMGSRGPIVSTMAARMFRGGIGTAYGLITLGMGIGGGLGSWLAGVMHEWTGGYQAGFTLAALATCLGLAQFWIVPELRDGSNRQV